MALSFKETGSHYVVIDTTYSFTKTTVRRVKYSKDLTTIQIENDPAELTTESTREWFKKHYLSKFESV